MERKGIKDSKEDKLKESGTVGVEKEKEQRQRQTETVCTL